MSQINSFLDLDVYKDAFALQQRIFELSKTWPAEECFSLTSQIRRSSRSIGANLAEACIGKRLGRMIEKHESFCLCVHESSDCSYPPSDPRPPTSDLRPPSSPTTHL